MSDIFTKLPGIQLPVGELTKTLREIWDSVLDDADDLPGEFRASQMNLLLHFGKETTPEDAEAQFTTALQFAERYPCRIVVLCPVEESETKALREAKLYTQCFVGASQAEKTCSEALILHYPRGVEGYLENQIAIWLETDLPTYHWMHRVSAERVRGCYHSFIEKTPRRLVFDRSLEGEGFAQVGWPRPEAVGDLAYARTLPVRQSVGQFLSAFEPEKIVDGLETVTVRHAADRPGEARGFLRWAFRSLAACCDAAGTDCALIDLDTEELKNARETNFEIVFAYRDGRFFRWTHKPDTKTARIETDLKGEAITVPQGFRRMSPPEALAEALFFEGGVSAAEMQSA